MKPALKTELLWLLDQLGTLLDKDTEGQSMIRWYSDTLIQDLKARVDEAKLQVRNEPQEFKSQAEQRRFEWSQANKCPECEAYDRVHDHHCPRHPDYDPTPE